ncbi:hypothetical protein FHS43_000030 [Streptosporangium becharense]|uniref:Uncharacterized protein n=1 Tax=Streptosporangium becharense TaxID=1816182 RepID=A0A7W9MH88_9ACTN|nr:hypothetical protein [Streptosporangium becharense]MBB2908784.1 hypothetical protein [Streptosporangium becharense]MBB5820198.1 hypothetical protein [Streptosporangium becharense]
MNTDLPEDLQRQRLRNHLESMIARTDKATSWRDAASSLRSLVNHEGYIPVRTHLSVEDLDFLEGAREELLDFATLGVRLLDLHQPRDAGGITSDAANPILRCRSCMWRWPCPTFRAMVECLGTSRRLTSCQRVEPDDGQCARMTLMVPVRPGEPGEPVSSATTPPDRDVSQAPASNGAATP